MNENAKTKSCPQCGAPVPPDAPQGLCPKCVLGGVVTSLDSRSGIDQPEMPTLEAVRAAFPALEVVDLIGEGGMGFVYKARQPKLERFVALKILLPKLGANPTFAERFSREARVLARLSHPNIVAVHDFGQSDGFYYLLMEFVQGTNLRQAMQAGRFTPEQALAVVPKVCEALQFAHDEGILHRDIKPENILLTAKGQVKIADFGIAKLVGEPRRVTRLTATGAAIGTPNYMAPEQLERPEEVDWRADIYSLGVVFYEMLTGELPIGRFAPPSQKVRLDVRLDEVVLKTLEKEPRRRYQHASELKTDVESVATNAPDRPASGTSPTRWSAKAIAGALFASVGLLPPLLMIVIAFFLAIPIDHAFSATNPLTQFLFGTVLALALASAGTLLGFLALREIRRAAGRLRGRGLAFWAALSWPLLLVNFLLLVTALFAGGVLVGSLGGGIGLMLLSLPVLLLVVLALDFFVLARAWKWAVSHDVVTSGRRPSLVPVTVALGVTLGVGIPALLLAFSVWLPMLAKSNRFSNVPKLPAESGPVREASMEVTAPARQRFTASWTVFSNNIPVMGPVLVIDTPTPAREPGQCALQWRRLEPASPASDGAPWEVVLRVGGTQRIVSRPAPGKLPGLEWLASGPQHNKRFESAIEESFDTQIFHAKQALADGSTNSLAQWNVRLTLKSSTRPQSITVTEGIGAEFSVPAGQVAVFEIVTRSNSLTVPIRHLAAHVVAPVERGSEGIFRLAQDAEQRDAGISGRSWRIEVSTADGVSSLGGFDLPEALPPAGGANALRLTLLPDREVVHWGIPDPGSPPADGSLGLRVRTHAHGLQPGMPGSNGASGTGTNWTSGSASTGAPTAR